MPGHTVSSVTQHKVSPILYPTYLLKNENKKHKIFYFSYFLGKKSLYEFDLVKQSAQNV